MWYLDVKQTIWERIAINSEDDYSKIVEMLKEGKSIENIYNEYNMDECESEILYDTATEMDINDNDENSTIELLDENMQTVWKNGK